MYLIMAGSINMFLDDDRRTPSSISDRNRETMVTMDYITPHRRQINSLFSNDLSLTFWYDAFFSCALRVVSNPFLDA